MELKCFSRLYSTSWYRHPHPRVLCCGSQRIKARHISGESKCLKSERRLLLERVYEPALKLDKDSMARYRLSLSGQCWLKFHNPGKAEPYLELQREHRSLIEEIDILRNINPNSAMQTCRLFVPSWSQQSSRLDGNSLTVEYAAALDKELEGRMNCRNFYRKVNIKQLRRIDLPEPTNILPGNDRDDVVELRNNLVVARWVVENAIANRKVPGLGTHEIRDLSAAIVKGLPSVQAYGVSPRVELGDYRRLLATITPDPLRIFPYPEEIPELMRGLIQWRDISLRNEMLHPLLLACQLCAYAMHVFPFPAGNGKVSRLLSLDLLVRHGYLPTLVGKADRTEYLKMISEAQDHNPTSLVKSMLDAQLAALKVQRDGAALGLPARGSETAMVA